MSEFGWALIVGFVVVIGALRVAARQAGRRLTPFQVVLTIPGAFLVAGLLLMTWRALAMI